MIISYCYNSHKKTTIYEIFKKTSQNKKISSHLKSIINSYNPTYYLPIAFSQLFFSIKRLKDHHYTIKFTKEEIKIKKRGVINIDWFPKNYKQKKNSPILIFFLGAYGDISVPYAKDFAKYTNSKNWRFCIINRRGFDFRKLKSPHFLEKEEFEDLAFVIKKLKKNYKVNFYLCGISNGANICGLLLGKYNLDVKAFCSISNPFNLVKIGYDLSHSLFFRMCFKKMVRKWGSILKFHKDCKFFNQVLKKKNISKQLYLDIVDNPERLMKAEFLIKLKNFEHAFELWDYYSCENVLDQIKIPCLFLNNKNDPICKKEFIPVGKLFKNEKFFSIFTERGGHAEFFSDYDMKRWGFLLALEYFAFFENKTI